MGARLVKMRVLVGALVCASWIIGPAGRAVVMAQEVTPGVAHDVATDAQPEHSATRAVVTLDVTNVPLGGVLADIARQAELRPIFVKDSVLAARRITMHVRNVAAHDAFATALAGTGVAAVISAGHVVFVAQAGMMELDVGEIRGVVTDARTKQPLRGVVVVLDDAKHGVTTDDAGAFRMSGVTAGTHVLHVRKLSYAKRSQSVTVVEGETATVGMALEASVNALEQVVVTGTVVATELKAIPNAITVITAKELEERGITRIDQLFRGDVPGLFVQRTGSTAASAGYPGGVDVWSRGTANLGGHADGIKTYVDGVELADKRRLALIDPSSIDRIEILTGPQASTIYGSNAINGVMQIFTKRGSTVRPQLTVTLRSDWAQNNFSAALAPTHRAELSVAGVEGRRSYNIGGSWGYIGSWSPSVKEQTLSGFGGERISAGPLTIDAHLRVDQDQNSTNARDDGQGGVVGNGDGLTGYIGGAAPLRRRGTSIDRAMGGTVTYPLTTWWSHTVIVGLDQFSGLGQQLSKQYSTPMDTTQNLTRNVNSGLTAAYTTTAQVPLSTLAKLVLTLGVDESHKTSTSINGQYVGVYSPAPRWSYSQTQAHEHGGFLTGQVGLWDALFLQYGLRAVYNPNIGRDQNPNLEPRYGVAYSRDVAGVTAKVRASYGIATRPPGTGLKEGIKNPYFLPYYGTDVQYLANPELMPESQQGGEGGVELYFGNRGSFQVTHFNQTVNDLIINAVVDSVDVLPADLLLEPWCAGFKCPLLQSQFVNIGNVRNQGWGAQGTLNLWMLTVTGKYSWTKSRMIGITPKYRGQWPQFAVGMPFNGVPEHTYAVGLAYVHGGTRIQYNLQGQGSWQQNDYDFFYRTGNGNDRSQVYESRMVVPYPFSYMRPGFYIGDLNMSQQFTRQVEGLVQINNVHNSYLSESNPLVPQTGRTTGIGLRVLF